jgi:hypothetical protein
MTTVVYNANSPYASTPQENQYLEYLGFWNGAFPNYSGSDGVITIQAKYDKRPDLLSQDLYGTTQWWWIFTLYNPNQIQDPIYDLRAGITLRYPSKNNLPRSLGGYSGN